MADFKFREFTPSSAEDPRVTALRERHQLALDLLDEAMRREFSDPNFRANNLKDVLQRQNDEMSKLMDEIFREIKEDPFRGTNYRENPFEG